MSLEFWFTIITFSGHCPLLLLLIIYQRKIFLDLKNLILQSLIIDSCLTFQHIRQRPHHLGPHIDKLCVHRTQQWYDLPHPKEEHHKEETGELRDTHRYQAKETRHFHSL